MGIRAEPVMNRKNIDSMYKNKLCHYCGVCYGVCPKDNIEFSRDGTGNFLFRVKEESRCGGCTICYSVCPGHEVDFISLNWSIFSREYESSFLGSFIDCALAHAKDPILRRRAASGGVVSSLLISALEAGEIDGATVVKLGFDGNPFKAKPFIARTKGEIVSGCGSKYQTVPIGLLLREILQSSGAKRYAFIGLPCQVHGLRKAQQIIPRLRERVGPVISLFCGRGSSPLATIFVLKRLGLKRENVAKIDYRYGKWPGEFTATLNNGEVHSLPLEDYMFIMEMFQNIRCLMCPDHTGEFADISIGDAWLKELKGQEGWNAVINRTALGKKLLREAQESENISVYEVDPVRVIESQKLPLCDKKIKIFPSVKIAKWCGFSYTIPQYSGIRPFQRPGFHEWLRAIVFLIVPRISASSFFRYLFPLVLKLPAKILKMDFKIKHRRTMKRVQKW